MKAWIVWGNASQELERLPSPGRIGDRVAVFLDYEEALREAKANEGELIEGTVDHFAEVAAVQEFVTPIGTRAKTERRAYSGVILIRDGQEVTP